MTLFSKVFSDNREDLTEISHLGIVDLISA